MRFEELHIRKELLKALEEVGYTAPTPIQEQAIPPVLAGQDVLGCAQTGTGKTAAFAIPILQRLDKPVERKGGKYPVRALILTPTRELALQIFENFERYEKYTGIKTAVIFGGVSQVPQVAAIKKGVDVLVATPGRLWDLMGQKHISLSDISCFVLDEADRMLDMGFFPDVKRIVRTLPKKRQTLLFSATMPTEIAQLADSLLTDPVRIAVSPVSTPVEKIRQYVYMVDRHNKRSLLAHIIKENGKKQTLVFTRTKHTADRVARELVRAGISASAIHGDKSQGARQRALSDFKANKICALVATDIAARGIDISGLPFVINFDLPEIPETYVHRIGRTGRAGLEGTAISLCDGAQMSYLIDIEELTGKRIEEVPEHAYPMTGEAPPAPAEKPQRRTGAPRPARQGGRRPAAKPGEGAQAKPQSSGGTPRRKPQSAAQPAAPAQAGTPRPQAANAPRTGQARTNAPRAAAQAGTAQRPAQQRPAAQGGIAQKPVQQRTDAPRRAPAPQRTPANGQAQAPARSGAARPAAANTQQKPAQPGSTAQQNQAARQRRPQADAKVSSGRPEQNKKKNVKQRYGGRRVLDNDRAQVETKPLPARDVSDSLRARIAAKVAKVLGGQPKDGSGK